MGWWIYICVDAVYDPFRCCDDRHTPDMLTFSDCAVSISQPDSKAY